MSTSTPHTSAPIPASLSAPVSAVSHAASGFAGEATVSDYLNLLKPRVMSLVIFSGLCGLLAAPGAINPILGAIGIFALAVGAGAAGAVNMWYDRDIDAMMNRTKDRPIPSGKVDPSEALTFALILSLFSVMIMGLAVNWVAAGLLAFANFFYSIVYTMWLKRWTAQNIVIGGAAGAFPPMIGWAMVTGGVDLTSLALFMIIFFWTPPHFWALALFACKDYARAGIPMLPCVRGETHTKRQMFVYTLLMWPVCALPFLTGASGYLFLCGGFALNLLFTLSAWRVLREPNSVYAEARKMFGYSIFYLFAIFLLLVMDSGF